jgi:phosphonate transport system substrate-binding protein
MIDGNHLMFITEGTLSSNATRILAQTEPYDHCNFTAGPSAPREMIERFRELLLNISYADASVRPLMDLEGLKSWREGRVQGYRALDKAVDEEVFYDREGRITVQNYRY